jgi:cytoplasmic tRNA 2-thiolation protein 1
LIIYWAEQVFVLDLSLVNLGNLIIIKEIASTMSKFSCEVCKVNKAMIKRPKTQQPICQHCFFDRF